MGFPSQLRGSHPKVDAMLDEDPQEEPEVPSPEATESEAQSEAPKVKDFVVEHQAQEDQNFGGRVP